METPGSGQVLSDTTIPARGHLGLELRAGQHLRLIDVEGQQVPDFIALSRNDPEEKLSCIYTKTVSGRWQLPPGATYYSNRCRPLLTVVADTVGTHHLDGGYCREESNFVRYGVHGTPNCHDNLVAALADLGLGAEHVQPDMCMSFFMNIAHHPDGRMEIQLPASRAGDYLELRAEQDLLVAISACPQERNPCNAFNPTSIRVVVTQPG